MRGGLNQSARVIRFSVVTVAFTLATTGRLTAARGSSRTGSLSPLPVACPGGGFHLDFGSMKL
jgi:hypothetical protein